MKKFFASTLIFFLLAPLELGATTWTLKASDDFNDTFGTSLDAHTVNSGSPWVEDRGDWKIGANDLSGDGSTGDARARNTTVLGNDQAAEITFSSGSTPGLMLRMDSSGNGYIVFVRNNVFHDAYIQLLTAGTRSALADVTGLPSFSDGDTIRFEAVGTSLVLKINGTTYISTTDGTYTSGSAGVFDFPSAFSLADNFAAYEAVVPAARIIRLRGVRLRGVRLF
jgi:hypothetical protein